MNESDQNARHFSVGWREQLDLDAGPSPAANLDLQWHLAAWEPVMHFWSEIFSDLAPGKRVLECGGATGRLPIYMARDGWQFTVIDITSEGPLLARERCSRAGVRGHFATADVFQLPFDDSSFDVVTSHGLLDLLTDIDSAVKEMTRVLKPGGLFTATAYPRRLSVQTVADVALMLPRAVSASRRTRSIGRRSQRPHRNNYSRQRYAAACEAAGLGHVVTTGVVPFPRIHLPSLLQRGYVRLTRLLQSESLAFNRSRAAWTSTWGTMLAIYGVKTRNP